MTRTRPKNKSSSTAPEMSISGTPRRGLPEQRNEKKLRPPTNTTLKYYYTIIL